jgi:hypothetical protein
MSEQINDMDHPENILPDSLDDHLRLMMAEEELKHFREQLPVEFLSDASEGLSQLKDTKQLQSVLRNLNHQMHHQLVHKKVHKRKRSIGNLSWTYWAIIIILLLSIVGYIVIRMFLHK